MTVCKCHLIIIFQIWTPTVTLSFILIIPPLSALLTYGEIKLYHAGSYIMIAIYNFHRLFILAFCVILVLIPVIKDLCTRRSTENLNSILFVNSSTGKAVTKQKIERQLLYETMFVCFWKTVDMVVDTIYYQTSTSFVVSNAMGFVMDASLYISNVGGLVALLFISSVSRTGFKEAFSIQRDGKSISISTRFSMVKRSTSVK